MLLPRPLPALAAAACFLLSAIGAARAASGPNPQPWDVQQSVLCTQAIAAAQSRHHLPPGLLGTMARVESGRPVNTLANVRAWPWTVDANGEGLFFESKQAAIVWTELAQARGVPFIDVGCLQVDLQMHPHAFTSLAQAFDPKANADYAARYLLRLRAEADGNWFAAVGQYHSHDRDLAAAYRLEVADMAAGIPFRGGQEPLYLRAMRAGTLHLRLVGGGVQIINTHRQPTRPGHPHLSSCQVAAIMRPLLARPPSMAACAHRVAGR
ncbi:MAG TPA: hypothetical protein VHY76_05525 [Acetobacteraceae bacterium]|jgi:hypothetical protein|nr:hypothetical protein [Acetobacteraceae bacterium]